MPSKVTPFRESTLNKMLIILKYLDKQALTPNELFKKSKHSIRDINEFVETVDCLYILGKISLDDKNGVLKRA